MSAEAARESAIATVVSHGVRAAVVKRSGDLAETKIIFSHPECCSPSPKEVHSSQVVKITDASSSVRRRRPPIARLRLYDCGGRQRASGDMIGLERRSRDGDLSTIAWWQDGSFN